MMRSSTSNRRRHAHATAHNATRRHRLHQGYPTCTRWCHRARMTLPQRPRSPVVAVHRCLVGRQRAIAPRGDAYTRTSQPTHFSNGSVIFSVGLARSARLTSSSYGKSELPSEYGLRQLHGLTNFQDFASIHPEIWKRDCRGAIIV